MFSRMSPFINPSMISSMRRSSTIDDALETTADGSRRRIGVSKDSADTNDASRGLLIKARMTLRSTSFDVTRHYVIFSFVTPPGYSTATETSK